MIYISCTLCVPLNHYQCRDRAIPHVRRHCCNRLTDLVLLGTSLPQRVMVWPPLFRLLATEAVKKCETDLGMTAIYELGTLCKTNHRNYSDSDRQNNVSCLNYTCSLVKRKSGDFNFCVKLIIHYDCLSKLWKLIWRETFKNIFRPNYLKVVI